MQRLDIRVLDGDAADVQFDDYSFFPRGLGPAILAPCKGGFDDAALRDAARVIASIKRQILAWTPDAIAEHHVAPANPTLQGLSVRVDQQFVRIEPMPV